MRNIQTNSYNFDFVDTYLKKIDKPASQILYNSKNSNDNNDPKFNSSFISQKSDYSQKSHTIRKMLNNSNEKIPKQPQTPSNLDKMMDKISNLLKTHDEIKEISSSKLSNCDKSSYFSSEKINYTRSFLDEADTPKKINTNGYHTADYLKELNKIRLT